MKKKCAHKNAMQIIKLDACKENCSWGNVQRANIVYVYSNWFLKKLMKLRAMVNEKKEHVPNSG